MATERKRDVFIGAIGMVPLDDYNCVPTAVSYTNEGRVAVGSDAFEYESEPRKVCNNFKIQLGEQEPGVVNPKLILFSDGKYRSIHSVTNDYLNQLVEQAERWIKGKALATASRVLVAEPVAIHEQGATKGSWLSNYRNHLRRILKPKFEDVDFLPEPFAVFQYYRYGSKHPLIAQKTKHVALVLDFGGGTFDVSVIETTAQGDISNSGRNSRPLAASSTAIGGFFFNRVIADHLLLNLHDGNKSEQSRIRDALKKYDEFRRDPRARMDDLREDYKNFFGHLENFLYEVEKAKKAICGSISDWALEGPLTRTVGYQIKVPRKPLSIYPEYVPVRLDAEALRKLFIERIWTKHLHPSIANALGRAKSELEAQKISVVLLSGGSSNIRWLHKLIKESDIRDLEDADLLELQEDFQEIVAKGLAIECARKTYSQGEGDFRAVTYNRLCLALDPDNRGVEIKRFRPVTEGLPINNSDGVLLPSASLLETYLDKPIRWKFTLSHPPKRHLDYFFMASSFDPEDTPNLHNAIDRTIHSPASPKFDSHLQVELSVKEDGTTHPRFIYKSASPGAPEIAVVGRPFYMDMTFGGSSGAAAAYMGIDFGTSNSSISYVEQTSIQVYAQRAKDPVWQDWSDLAGVLPYPIAFPLTAFVSTTNAGALDLKAIEVIEGFLMFAAYVAYAEFCAFKPRAETKLFKEFSQRSAGPLWALLRKALEQLKNKGEFSKPLQSLFESPIREEMDALVTAIGQVKHGKSEQSPDYQRFIKVLGNIFSGYGDKFLFGYFQDVQKVPFRRAIYRGLFRQAIGGHPPFITMFEYEGETPFSEEQAVLVSRESGRVLSLTPLMFWSRPLSNPSQMEADLHIYDISEKGRHSYKLVGAKSSVGLDDVSDFAPLVSELDTMKEKDSAKECVEEVRFNESQQ